ncbi:hypothetical protein [Cellulomonas sp. ATA003]|uniref:hypothetical protein n=1 Tax=Cellulomonas sp. ATA003 TaxID=3073064 RepID=UPI002872F9DF|nr:hypothetical protein [Cellulomonas sp. ATA003]WNB87191.1 hypothetical protein REH70_08805 [Cellulomonas sp. ATA003]
MVAVVLTVVLHRVDELEGSVWEMLDQGPRWFLFAMGIAVVTGYLTAHVANGMTRRSFTAAATVAGLGVVAAYAVVTAVGYLVERAVFDARGWPTTLGSHHLYTDTGQIALVLAENGLVPAVYAASGLCVGAVYYRGGGWWGTLTLPLTVGPVLVAEAAARPDWVAAAPGPLGGGDPLPTVVLAAVCLGLAAALLAVTHAALRGAPLRAPTG